MIADVMTVSQQKLWLPQGQPNCQDQKGPCLVTVCHAKAGKSNCFKQVPPLESQLSWLWTDTLLTHIVLRFPFFKYQNDAFFRESNPFDIYFQPYLNVYTYKGLSAILVTSPNSFIAITLEAFMISGKNVPSRHRKKHRICQHKITPRSLQTLLRSLTPRRTGIARSSITRASDSQLKALCI